MLSFASSRSFNLRLKKPKVQKNAKGLVAAGHGFKMKVHAFQMRSAFLLKSASKSLPSHISLKIS